MTVHVTSTARIRAVFPGWLDLAGRVSSRTLAGYRYDASKLSPNTINRRLAAIKRLAKASTILKCLPTATAQEFSLVENAQVAPLRHRLRKNARVKIEPPEMRALVEAPDTRSLLGLRHTGGYMLEVLGKEQAQPRPAPLSLDAHAAIEAWLQARARYVNVQHIFTGFKGPGISGIPTAGPLSAWSGWKVVRKYAKAIGLDLKLHDLRRFVGTQLAARNLRSAQLALGHERLETTAQHYVLDELQAGLTDGLY